jgi:hypothetical protein
VSELLSCISRRISYVLLDKFPGTAQVVRVAVGLTGEESKNVAVENPLLYMELLDQLSDLTLILVVSFPKESWVYEFLKALRGNADLTAVLNKYRNQITKYCDSQHLNVTDRKLGVVEELCQAVNNPKSARQSG